MTDAPQADTPRGDTTRVAAPLSFTGVSHWYGDVVAVNDITCTVPPGITGLLGPNGAGKSTLLQLAAGMLRPSHGTVHVFGESPAAHPAIYRHVALVPEREALPDRMRARDFVAARAAMLGLADVRTATQDALAQVEMDHVATHRIATFSKGMKQRVKLAAALVHAPALLLLDEPFNGLDPRQRAQMLAVLHARAAAGTAVLLSSHILEEIAGVAERTLVLLAGRLAASGDYRTLRRLMTDQPHTVRIQSSDNRALAAELVRMPAVRSVAVESEGLLVRTDDTTVLSRTLAATAQALSCTLYEVQVTDDTLEHVFAYLVAR